MSLTVVQDDDGFEQGKVWHCPGCGIETRFVGPVLGDPRTVDPYTNEPLRPLPQGQFCSYQCWLRHRKETGQDG